MAFTKGKGVDKVVDSTGASILDRSFATIRRLGHVVSYGEAEGRPFPNLWERLVTKSLTFTRFHLGYADFASQIWRRGVDEVVGEIMKKTLKVPIEERFPFEKADAMIERLSSRQVSGKLTLEVNPS